MSTDKGLMEREIMYKKMKASREIFKVIKFSYECVNTFVFSRLNSSSDFFFFFLVENTTLQVGGWDSKKEVIKKHVGIG